MEDIFARYCICDWYLDSERRVEVVADLVVRSIVNEWNDEVVLLLSVNERLQGPAANQSTES